MTTIDRDDLAMLAAGFEAAMREHPDGDDASSALFELGWGELLAEAGIQGAALAFGALGTTGAATGIIDDVLLRAFGLDPDPATAVVLPAPAGAAPAGHEDGQRIAVDGMVSSRLGRATAVIVPVSSAGGVELVRVDATLFPVPDTDALDPGRSYRRLRAEIGSDATEPVNVTESWETAVAAARVALAHQLVAASRTMLDQARSHAIDRVQFGRAVASFQAVRHKLAESLVRIEGAAAVIDAVGTEVDPLHAALAKSLAGEAARTTATHAQQVLAGIGFTTDHPFQGWLKRALVVDLVLGSSQTLPTEIGTELLRRGAAPRLVEL